MSDTRNLRQIGRDILTFANKPDTTNRQNLEKELLQLPDINKTFQSVIAGTLTLPQVMIDAYVNATGVECEEKSSLPEAMVLTLIETVATKHRNLVAVTLLERAIDKFAEHDYTDRQYEATEKLLDCFLGLGCENLDRLVSSAANHGLYRLVKLLVEAYECGIDESIQSKVESDANSGVKGAEEVRKYLSEHQILKVQDIKSTTAYLHAKMNAKHMVQIKQDTGFDSVMLESFNVLCEGKEINKDLFVQRLAYCNLSEFQLIQLHAAMANQKDSHPDRYANFMAYYRYSLQRQQPTSVVKPKVEEVKAEVLTGLSQLNIHVKTKIHGDDSIADLKKACRENSYQNFLDDWICVDMPVELWQKAYDEILFGREMTASDKNNFLKFCQQIDQKIIQHYPVDLREKLANPEKSLTELKDMESKLGDLAIQSPLRIICVTKVQKTREKMADEFFFGKKQGSDPLKIFRPLSADHLKTFALLSYKWVEGKKSERVANLKPLVQAALTKLQTEKLAVRPGPGGSSV